MTDITASSGLTEQPRKWSASQVEGLISFVIALVIAGALTYGWLHRAESPINPEKGLGYALGITGGSMMLLLLVYPFRKRIRMLSAIGSVSFWFRFHMMLGLLGPVLILFHSRFTWGALNSAVALGAMLIVAGSGLIGRFLYARVHRGYSGRKIEVRGLLGEMHDLVESMASLQGSSAALRTRLEPFEKQAVAAGASFWSSARSVVTLGLATRQENRALAREIRSASALANIAPAHLEMNKRRLTAQSSAFFHAVRRAAEFAFYDRMLRLWHLLHLPLFFLLVATAIIHVVAVHMY
jgi:hypothetical protein